MPFGGKTLTSDWSSGQLIFYDATAFSSSYYVWGIDKNGTYAYKPLIGTVTLTAGDNYSGLRMTVISANPSNTYGAAGYFETDVTGTAAGNLYGFGSWINFNNAPTLIGRIVAAQDNGIYGTATVTGSILIYGMRMECQVTGSPNAFCPFSISTTNPTTAIFYIGTGSDLGVVSSTPTAAACGSVPLYYAPNGDIKWIRIYSSSTA